MMAGHRGRAQEAALRTNAAAEMLAAGADVADASRQLARRHRLSERQARRYVERARDHGKVETPKTKVVFTVKVAVDLVRRVRTHAKRSGQTMSALVAQALGEFLDKVDSDGRRGP